MRVLGIDPGLRFVGYAVVDRLGSKVEVVDRGILKLSASSSIGERLVSFYDFFAEKIPFWGISAIVFERPFLGENIQSYVKLGYTHGLVHMMASRFGVSLEEFAPSQVKQALAGSGSASKEQVARMVFRLFPLLPQNERLDLTDALAVALCGLWRMKR